MELGSIIFFLSIIFNYFLIKNYKNFFLKKIADTQYSKPQAFHKFPAIRSGGLTIIIFLLLFSIFYEDKNNYFLSIISLSSSFFFIGFLEDIKINLNPLIRLFFLLFFSFLIIYYFDINVINTQIEFLNKIINYNKFCSIIFVCLCLLFITNGSNFIDGFNGLLILHALIILGALYFIDIFNSNNLFLQNLILFFISILFSILFFNFPNSRIFLGDSGAYIIGVILSLITIQVSNLNSHINPFFFAVLLFYIFFEVIFSFFRKILIDKVSPLKPDNKHLHMLFFNFINYKIKNRLIANSLTGLIINIIYLIIILPVFFFYKNPLFCKTYFFFLLISYLLFYFFLEKKNYKNK